MSDLHRAILRNLEDLALRTSTTPRPEAPVSPRAVEPRGTYEGAR